MLLNFRDNGCIIGLGYVDFIKRVVGLFEFFDDSYFINVEFVLVGFGCKECLLAVDIVKFIESRGLFDVLLRCGVMVIERKKIEFKVRDLV